MGFISMSAVVMATDRCMAWHLSPQTYELCAIYTNSIFTARS